MGPRDGADRETAELDTADTTIARGCPTTSLTLVEHRDRIAAAPGGRLYIQLEGPVQSGVTEAWASGSLASS
jgi:hypothetical protein